MAVGRGRATTSEQGDVDTAASDDALPPSDAPRARAASDLIWRLLLIGVVIGAAVVRKGHFRGRPLWLDEAWVVDSVRTSPLRVFGMSYPGPPVWEWLLRLVPDVGGPERYRVVPFLASMAAIAPAAGLGLLVGAGRRTRRWWALAGALSVALLPHIVRSQDVKQYTTEAFIALGLVWLFGRLDRDWSPRRLVAVCLVAAPIVLVGSTAAFVSAAAFAGLCASLAIARRWRPLLLTAAAGASVIGVNTLLLLKVSLRGPAEELRNFWRFAFIPRDDGIVGALRFAGGRLRTQVEFSRLHWWVVLALVACGLVALWRRGMRAVALTGPVLLVGLAIAGVAEIYPFMDRSTSLFVMAIAAVYVGFGVAWIVGAHARSRSGLMVALAGGAVLAGLLLAANVVAMRPSFPLENVREQVAYVQRHRATTDVVAVGYPASFGFAYYWPDRPTFVPATRREPTIRFAVRYPDTPGIVIADFRADADIRAALTEALSRAGGGGRVWVVISHDRPDAWWRSIPPGVRAERISISLGPSDALLLLTPATG